MVQKIFWTILWDNINLVLSLLSNGDSSKFELMAWGGWGHFEYVYISFPRSHDKVLQGLKLS